MSRLDEIGLIRKGYLAAKQAANQKLSKFSGAADARADETAATRDMVYRWERWSQQNRQQATPAGVLEFIRQTYGERAFGFAAQEMAKLKLVSSTAASASPEAQEAQVDATKAAVVDGMQAQGSDISDDPTPEQVMREWGDMAKSVMALANKNETIEGDDLISLKNFLEGTEKLFLLAETGIDNDLVRVAAEIKKSAVKILTALANRRPHFAAALDSLDANKLLGAKVVASKRGNAPSAEKIKAAAEKVASLLQQGQDDKAKSNLEKLSQALRQYDGWGEKMARQLHAQFSTGKTLAAYSRIDGSDILLGEAAHRFIRRDRRTEMIIEAILLSEDNAKPLSNRKLYAIFTTLTPILLQDGIIEMDGAAGSGGGGGGRAAQDSGEQDDDKGVSSEKPKATEKGKGDATYSSVEEGLLTASGGWGSVSPAAFKEVLTQARRMTDNFTGFESQIASYEAQIKPLLDNPKLLLWLLARKSR